MNGTARGLADANDLQIAGVQPFSSVDWPGKLVATVFAQGCPWACPYCHNHAIIDCRTPGVVPFSRVWELLERRLGLLDGCVFSGGEPLRQEAVVPAMGVVRDLGVAVGLHTAGPYPARLARVLEAGLVDWVGLDVKALPDAYGQVVGRAGAGVKAWESLEVVVASGVAYEVRVTVYPGGPDPIPLLNALYERSVKNLALQRARDEGAPAGFAAHVPGWGRDFAEIARKTQDIGFSNLTVR